MDDVLGLHGDKKPAGADGAPTTEPGNPALDKARDRVTKALDEKELDSLLAQVLGGMRTSADRLGAHTDSGLVTQRTQQEVLAKLDILIEEASKRCKKSSSSGSSQCESPQSKKDGKSDPKDGQAKKDGDKPTDSKTREAGSKAGATAANAAGAEPSPLDPVDQGKLLDETRAEWGNLPARIRDLIRQGSRDRIAALYQRLTEEYYRRMAEDASR